MTEQEKQVKAVVELTVDMGHVKKAVNDLTDNLDKFITKMDDYNDQHWKAFHKQSEAVHKNALDIAVQDSYLKGTRDGKPAGESAGRLKQQTSDNSRMIVFGTCGLLGFLGWVFREALGSLIK